MYRCSWNGGTSDVGKMAMMSGISPSKRTVAANGAASITSVTAQQMRGAAPATPLDFSFMGLLSLSDMQTNDPVGGKKKECSVEDGSTKHAQMHSAVSLRVNNNKLEHLDEIDEALAAVFDDPAKLQWVDLSGNAIKTIPKTAFTKYPDVFTLQLHGNQLSKFSDVDNLAACLPRLHSLTLHGNPLEEKKHYRSYVISSFPCLKQLDFSSVTKGDREKADTWAKIYKKAVQASRAKGKRGDSDME